MRAFFLYHSMVAGEKGERTRESKKGLSSYFREGSHSWDNEYTLTTVAFIHSLCPYGLITSPLVLSPNTVALIIKFPPHSFWWTHSTIAVSPTSPHRDTRALSVYSSDVQDFVDMHAFSSELICRIYLKH